MDNQNRSDEFPCGDCSTVQDCPEPTCPHEVKLAAYAARRAAWTQAVGRAEK